MTADECTCGCSTLTSITKAEQACACGCDCCTPAQLSREDEIAELRQLRDAADRRLEELEAS